MPTRLWLRLTEILVTLALAAIVVAAWRADRRDRAKLAADLAVARQALAQLDARQHGRDTQLAQTLASLGAEKRSVTTSAQIIRALPQQIPLPVPITLQAQDPTSKPQTATCSAGRSPRSPAGLESTAPPCKPWSSTGQPFGAEDSDPASAAHSNPSAKPAEPSGVIPAADLKPLYDFALDCKACQAKLAAAQADLTDERAKTAVLTRERDEAVRAAKGGSFLRRVARNAKWLAIGAAAGAIASKAHR
jgi:type II secretory pathway pseudopilin PulG